MINATSVTLEELIAPAAVEPTERMFVELNKKGDHYLVRFENSYTRLGPDGREITSAVSTSRKCRDFLNRFPEKLTLQVKFPSEKISVPATDVSALVLDAWPKTQAELSLPAYFKRDNAVKQYNRQKKAARIIAEYKENKTVSCNGRFKVHAENPLLPYQVVALHAAVTARNFALFMEQGTGKTPAVIARICNGAEKAAERGEHYRAIIICPKNVKFNWHSEFARFGTCKGDVRVIRGTKVKRTNRILTSLILGNGENKFTVLVINYEGIKNALEIFKMAKIMLAKEGKLKPGKRLFNLAVLDESHYIKSPGAIRSKAALKLRDEAKYRMVLTGTPITNNPFDLYMQLEFLEAGMSGYGTYTAFKKAYGVFEPGGMGFEKLVDLQNIPMLKERLSRVSFQIRKKEALPDLPEKLYDAIEVEMSKEQAELYKTVATELLAEIEVETKGSTMSKEVEANHILTKLLRLAQVTSGFVGFSEKRDDEGKVIEKRDQYFLKTNPKLEALIKLLKAKPSNEKSIVWCCFVPDIKVISERLEQEGIKFVSYYGETKEDAREIAKDTFNSDPEIKVFLGNPAAASTGLNLLGYPPGQHDEYETDCTQVIYYSQNWSAPLRVQSEDRAHRKGTRKVVQITDLVVPNSIDTEIRARVQSKREMAEEVSDVRSILKDILTHFENIDISA